MIHVVAFINAISNEKQMHAKNMLLYLQDNKAIDLTEIRIDNLEEYTDHYIVSDIQECYLKHSDISKENSLLVIPIGMSFENFKNYLEGKFPSGTVVIASPII